ncbi:MAG: hypothetical protein ACI4EC_02205 [Lachnospiraceae bacterium]|mgnify:CR=1 FL=1
MNVTGTINVGMAKAARCMRNGVDNCKTDGKIAEQKKIIKALTREIGNLTIVRLEAGEEMCPEIMERYNAITRLYMSYIQFWAEQDFSISPEVMAKQIAEFSKEQKADMMMHRKK